MKYIYEFIGTFFLVLTVGMTALDPHSAGLLAPLAIGSVLAVMVFAGAHVSLGHYNPAVSLAAFMRKKINGRDLGLYWIAQFVAGLVAAFAVFYFKGEQVPAPFELSYFKALLAEFLFTFALCYVVLNVTTARGTEGNSYFGWAIGFTVLAGSYSVGAISGGAFNPSVALGLIVLNALHWTDIWIYLVGNFAGAAVAALLFNATHLANGKNKKTLG